MLTKEDIKLLQKDFATKEDLSNLVKEIIEYINSSSEATRIQTVREIRQTIREELSPILQNHELRIRKLEKDHRQN